MTTQFVRSLLGLSTNQRRVLLPTSFNKTRSILSAVAISPREIGSFRQLSTESTPVVLHTDIEQEAAVLTRTMVRRMRVLDIRQELVKRNIAIENEKVKRDDLMLLLLNALPSRRSSSEESDIANDEPISEVSLAQEELLPPPERRSNTSENRPAPRPEIIPEEWWETYNIAKATVDRKKTYIVSLHGDRYRHGIKTGIGIVLRDDDDKIVWMAQKFYPRRCTLNEASYSAIILALRFTLQRFGLLNLVVRISDERVINEINGFLLPGNATHQWLREEVFQLQVGNVAKYVTFEKLQDDCDEGALVRELAFAAMKSRKSLNFGDSIPVQYGDRSVSLSSLLENPLTGTKEAVPIAKLPTEQSEIDRVIDPSRFYFLRSDASIFKKGRMVTAGWAILNDQGHELWSGGELLPEGRDIKEAEVSALFLGLRRASSEGIKRLRCELDANKVIEILQRGPPFRLPNDVWSQTHSLMDHFETCSLMHIPRVFNSRANVLCRSVRKTWKAHTDAERNVRAKVFKKVNLGRIFSGLLCDSYDVADVNIDREKTYVATIHGGGRGIGIVLSEGDHVVWRALKYFDYKQSASEGLYSAVIIALRFAIHRFGLTNVVVQINDKAFQKEIEAASPAKELRHQILRKEVLKLQWGQIHTNVTFQKPSKDHKDRSTAHALALEAFAYKKFFQTKDVVNLDDAKLGWKTLHGDPLEIEPGGILLSKEADEPNVRDTCHVVDPSNLYVLRSFGDTSKYLHYSGAGWVIFDNLGREVSHGGKLLGKDIALEEAKMRALNIGLNVAFSLGIKRIVCESDSQAVFDSLNGFREVEESGNSDQILCDDTVRQLELFKTRVLKCVPLDHNDRAHSLCREVIYAKLDELFDHPLRSPKIVRCALNLSYDEFYSVRSKNYAESF